MPVGKTEHKTNPLTRNHFQRIMSGGTQEIIHAIKAGPLPDNPSCSPHRATGKRVPTLRTVYQFYSLANTAEQHGVLANNVTGAHGLNANR